MQLQVKGKNRIKGRKKKPHHQLYVMNVSACHMRMTRHNFLGVGNNLGYRGKTQLSLQPKCICEGLWRFTWPEAKSILKTIQPPGQGSR